MGTALLLQDYISPTEHLEDIHKSLDSIQAHLLQELSYKQSLLIAKDQEISELKAALDAKIALVEELNTKVLAVERNNEGNKQLNKKLISEIVRKQQDIEWYKRTFEKRSLLGTLKEKISKKLF
jgi:activator of HSP90 ATPase